MSSWKIEEKLNCNMFEREKPITNISLTFLGVANKFDIIVVWKSYEYILWKWRMNILYIPI